MGGPSVSTPKPPELGPPAFRNARRLARLTDGNASDIISQARAMVPGATAGVQIGAVIRQMLRDQQQQLRGQRREERRSARLAEAGDPEVQAEAEATRRAIQRRGRGRASTILTTPGAAIPTGQIVRKALLGA